MIKIKKYFKNIKILEKIKELVPKRTRILLYGIGFIFSFVFFINLYIEKSTNKYIYNSIDEIPRKEAVMVLGAQVYGEKLSYVLKDRLKEGIRLYNDEKVEKLLLSGDHGRINYDEVNTMRKYILRYEENIEKEDIFMDHAGFDTYDSMYRAKEIFCVKKLIIVTQDFHINRAVYIARKLGIDAVGIGISEAKYPDSLRKSWKSRENLARVKAFLNVIFKSKPKYLGKKIPITGDGRLTWDQKEEE